MKITTVAALIAAGLLAGGVTPAAASCCDHTEKGACCDKITHACCKEQDDPIAEAVLLPNLDEPRPARETMAVRFDKPVKIGDRVLQGNYVIEHDNNRMARGGPCTYIYAASDLRLPVVTFHCTHLERAPSRAPTIVLRSLGEPNGMKEFVAFQFAGEMGAHGVPADR